MKFSGRFTSGLVLLFIVQFSTFSVFAAAQLDIRIEPSNDALKANIEGYVGSLGERDEEEIGRASCRERVS